MLGPGADGAVGMSDQGPRAVSVCCHAPLWERLRRRPWPAHPLFGSTAGSLRFGCSGGGGSSAPYPPLSVIPWNSFTCGSHSGVFVPPGQLATPGLSMPCGNSNPPPTPLRCPNGVSATLEASPAPLLAPHYRGLVGQSRGLAALLVAPHSLGLVSQVFLLICDPPP